METTVLHKMGSEVLLNRDKI